MHRVSNATKDEGVWGRIVGIISYGIGQSLDSLYESALTFGFRCLTAIAHQ
ncbi:MAG: hypothetical protein AAFY26_23750 [Cyanobacteria bacterium J06638_22]